MAKRFALSVLATVAGLCVAAVPALAQNPGGVFGLWLTEDQTARVEISRCSDPAQGELCGRVVWLKEARNPDGSPAPSVEMVHDVMNADASQRERKILGLELLSGFHADPAHAGAYVGGHIYNAEDGKTYKAEIKLKSPDTLVLRGYVLMPLLGESETWTRVR